MIEVKKDGVLLKNPNLDFESEGVLNRAVISDSDHIHIFSGQSVKAITLPLHIVSRLRIA